MCLPAFEFGAQDCEIAINQRTGRNSQVSTTVMFYNRFGTELSVVIYRIFGGKSCALHDAIVLVRVFECV